MEQSKEANPAQAPPRFYRPELDVLRFLAFFLVFVYHIALFTDGIGYAIQRACSSGMGLFFLLSAYLITELLQREAASTGTISLSAFYTRRILRIWPLYFGFLLFGYLLDYYSGAHMLSVSRMLAYIFLAGNWYMAKYGIPISVVAPLWSISLEEQFYLFWPSLRRFCRPAISFAVAIATIPCAYITIAWLCHRHATLHTQIWVNTFVQAQFFGIGAILAILLHGRTPRLHAIARLALFCFALMTLLAGQLVFHARDFVGSGTFLKTSCGYLCFAVGCIALFFSFFGYEQIRSWRVLIYLGKISYGLYIFHVFVDRMVFHSFGPLFRRLHFTDKLSEILQFPIVLGLTILLAHLSYRYFESPFLRLKDRFAIIRTRPV